MKIFNFCLQYMNRIHIEYIDFSSINFFIILFNYFFLFYGNYVLITLISVTILYQEFNFLLKRSFYQREDNQLFPISKTDAYTYHLL